VKRQIGHQHVHGARLRHHRLRRVRCGQRLLAGHHLGALLGQHRAQRRPHEFGGLRDQNALSRQGLVHAAISCKHRATTRLCAPLWAVPARAAASAGAGRRQSATA